MKTRTIVKVLLVLGFVVSLVSCGDPQIRIGQKISGSITESDNYWINYDPYYHTATDDGYSDDFQVSVTKGHSYTVTLWTSTGKGSFEDKEEGRFYYSDGVSGTSFSPIDSNPQTVEWIPSKTGLNAVDVYAFSWDTPIEYTVEISD